MRRLTGAAGFAAALLHGFRTGAVVALVIACSDAATDDPLVRFAQLEDPITLSAHLSNLEPADGRHANEDNAALVALAMEAGFVTIEPQPEAGPYWRFAVRDATRDDDTITFPAARRALVNVSDQRTQEEGRGQVRSATLRYVVRFDDRFEAATREIGPFAMRVVAAKASEHSRWRLREREYLGRDGDLTSERDALAAVAIDAGRPLLPTLATRIEEAKERAFEAIERRLLDSGRIAFGDAPGTIVLPEAGLMFWTRSNAPRSLSQQSAAALCANARVEHYEDWRLPTRAEFAAALDGDAFLDTPDRRFWGDVARPPPAGRVAPFAIDETRGQGAYYLHPTGEVRRASPPATDPQAAPSLRPAAMRALCVRSVD